MLLRMSRNYSDEVAREERRNRVLSYYVRGYRQTAIAELVGCDQKTVSNDLAVIRRQWAKANGERVTELQARELARIDEIERQAWAAWERSQQERSRSRTKRTDPGGGPAKLEASVEKETPVGDPRWLERVSWCVEARVRILGLAAHDQLDKLIKMRQLATADQVGELLDAVTEIVLAEVADPETRRRIGRGVGRLVERSRAEAGLAIEGGAYVVRDAGTPDGAGAAGAGAALEPPAPGADGGEAEPPGPGPEPGDGGGAAAGPAGG
jgi:hypothetical protein